MRVRSTLKRLKINKNFHFFIVLFHIFYKLMIYFLKYIFSVNNFSDLLIRTPAEITIRHFFNHRNDHSLLLKV